jgi:hypothetical protein
MRIALVASAMIAALSIGACRPSEETPVEASTSAVSEPVMPADAPPQEEVGPEAGPGAGEPAPGSLAAEAAGPQGCAAAIGQTAAQRLVERCIAVSPATRPPCNVANPCALIQGEIDRACDQYGPGEIRPIQCSS